MTRKHVAVRVSAAVGAAALAIAAGLVVFSGAEPPAAHPQAPAPPSRTVVVSFGKENALRLQGGGSLVVRHAHDMHAYPCLAPGDSVKLLTVKGFAAA